MSEILKTFWQRRGDGKWYGVAIKSLDLRGERPAHKITSLPYIANIVLTQASPAPGIPFQSVGTVRSFSAKVYSNSLQCSRREPITLCGYGILR